MFVCTRAQAGQNRVKGAALNLSIVDKLNARAARATAIGKKGKCFIGFF